MNKTKLLKNHVFAVLLVMAAMALPENAVADYASSCAGCHGPLATSSKKGASASKIQSAINGNTGGMGSLSGLTGKQVDDIAIQLGGAPTCVSPKTWNTAGTVCAAPPPPPPPTACTGNNISTTGNAPCTPCPTGQTANAGHTACAGTPPPPPPTACTGNNISATGKLPCTPCPTGQTANAGHTACAGTPPPPPPTACTGNNISATGKAPCTPCPTGQTANAGHTACATTTPPPPPPPAGCEDSDDHENGEHKGDHDNDGHEGDSKSKNKKSKHGKCLKPDTKTGSVGQIETVEAKTDVYDVKCTKHTKSLSVSVMDLAPVNDSAVSIQATKGAASSGISTDDADGDGNHSSWQKLTKGSGHYLAKVNKSESSVTGPELYKALFSCQDAKGKQTKARIKIKQNQ